MARPTTIRRHTGRCRLHRCIATIVATVLASTWCWTAVAATTDTVAVTSTVGSVLSVTDTCSSAVAISVSPNSFQAGTCGFQFGSTNDATTTLRITSSAGPLLAGGVFADHLGGCGALIGDTAGIKVSGAGAGVSGSLGCPVSASATNADFLAVPDSATAACAGTTTGITANTCTLAVGIREVGADATAGSYTGTLNMDVIG